MIKYFEETIEIIKEAFESIDELTYNKLVGECEDVLKAGGKIITSGLGKNVPICEKFEGTMNSYGMDARFLHTNTAVHGDLGIVRDKDLVILLSKSGNTAETLVLAKQLQKRNCKVWAMTFGRDSKVCKLVHENFVMELKDEGDSWNIVPNNSTTIYLMVLQAIAIELSKRFAIT